MRTPRILTLSALALALSLAHPAQAANDADLAQIREQIKQMKDAYEKRIAALENRLAQAESTASKAETVADKAEASASPVSYTHLDVYKRQRQLRHQRLDSPKVKLKRRNPT